MRKIALLESLFYKTNICLQKTATCIGLQAEQVCSVIDIFNIFFFSFRRDFYASFSMLFSEPLSSCDKRKIDIMNCTSICMSSKILSHIFKIIFQTRNIKLYIFH